MSTFKRCNKNCSAIYLLSAICSLYVLSSCGYEIDNRIIDDSIPWIRPPTERRIAPINHPVSRVLFIGLDGVRPDAILAAHTPHLKQHIHDGAFTLSAITQRDAATWSGPGWATLLTGVNPMKHRVGSNKNFQDTSLRLFPTVLWRAKHIGHLSTAMAVHWSDLSDFIVEPDATDARYVGTDEEVTHSVEQFLLHGNFSLIFAHLDDIDHAGHAYGFSPDIPEYRSAIEIVDTQIGRMIAALNIRQQQSTERWTVIITTDHGGTISGHGERNDECRRIFVIAIGNDVIPGELTPIVNQVDITPTILDLLGVHDNQITDGTIL